MAFSCTQAERDALAAAINDGVRSVSYDGKSVSYPSTAVMLALLARQDAYLAGTTSTPRSSVASFAKGLR